MRQRNLVVSTRTSSVVSSGKVESQYLVGAFSPSGHSISNHSSAGGAANCQSREADRTRTRFGLELHAVGDMRFAPPRRVASPILRQIELIGDGKARRMVGDR